MALSCKQIYADDSMASCLQLAEGCCIGSATKPPIVLSL